MRQAPASRRSWLFLPFIVFGCALRFGKLSGVGLWYDELWTVVGASQHDLGVIYREWLLGDPHPPGFTLFYFAYFKLFPNDELWARLPCALAGVANVLFVLIGARRTFTRHERVFAATFVALSHGLVSYALTCKQYSAMLLLLTVSLVACLEVAQTRRLERRLAWWLGLSVTALAWLNSLAMLAVLVFFVFLLVMLWSERAERLKLLRLAAVISLACLPLVSFQLIVLRYTPGDWQKDSWAQLAGDALPYLFFSDERVTWLAGGLLEVAVVSLALDEQARRGLVSSRNAQLLTLGGVTLGLLLLLGAFKPLAFIRYFLIAFPPLLLGLGVLCAAAFSTRRAWLLAVPLAFFGVASFAEAKWVDGLRRQEWDKSVDLVLARVKPGDAIAVLGAKQDKTMFDYLRAGDEWGLYYVRNLSFYRYYFERRGAQAWAQSLEVVQPSPESAQALLDANVNSGRTVWVLGGHHIKYGDDVLEVLRQRAKHVELTTMFSTRVYRLDF